MKIAVTGGSGKAGRAVVRDLREHGHDVLNVDRVPSHEDTAPYLPADLTDYGQTLEALSGGHVLPGIEAVVHLAAIPAPDKATQDVVFRTNIISMFHLCQAAVPKMEPGSTIVNTTSIQAAQPSPQLLHYAATKGAISTFTKGLAQELAEQGIRVNAVAPGPIWTPLVIMSFPAEKNAEFGADTPLGRPGQPGELAPIYVFLATEASQYISGEVIGATGGKPLH